MMWEDLLPVHETQSDIPQKKMSIDETLFPCVAWRQKHSPARPQQFVFHLKNKSFSLRSLTFITSKIL